MDRSPHTISTSMGSAAYGQACSHCVKAKCKCVPKEGGSCERCHRLAKDCQPATYVRKRGARKAVGSSSTRTSKLEDKLDSLVTLLQAQNAPNPDATTTITRTPLSTKAQTDSLHAHPPQSEILGMNCVLRHFNPLERVAMPTPATTVQTPTPSADSPHRDANQILSIFRTRFLEQFPIIDLPNDKSAEQFQRERPMTFKVINVFCDYSWEKQCEAGKGVREEIARRAVVEGERSVDLLLASMVFTIWHFYFTRAKPDLGMFSGICRVMITYMRLMMPCTSAAQFCPKPPALYDLPEVGETRTDEEIRILLAHFSFSAILFMSLRHEPWRWSPRLEDFCQKLSLTSKPGDQILIAITRISKVSIEATRTVQRLCEEPEYGSHVLFQIKSLQQTLDQVQVGLTTEHLQNKLVRNYLHCTSTLIYESTFFLPPPAPTPVDSMLDFHIITNLSSCLHSCKATLDVVNETKFAHINMPMILSWSHAIQILFKLSVLDYPGWDRQLVRSTADVLWYFEKAAELLKASDQELQQLTGMPESIFSKTSELLRNTIALWKEHLERSGVFREGTESAVLDGLGGFDVMDTSWLNFSDDVWLSSSLAYGAERIL